MTSDWTRYGLAGLVKKLSKGKSNKYMIRLQKTPCTLRTVIPSLQSNHHSPNMVYQHVSIWLKSKISELVQWVIIMCACVFFLGGGGGGGEGRKLIK